MSEFMKKVVLDYIEDEYDLKIYKEYLKEKENGTLKTFKTANEAFKDAGLA